jgi:hypothetical protein
MGTGDDEAPSEEASDVQSLGEYFRQELPEYFARRAKLPALSWRARFLVALPVALLLARGFANDPRHWCSFAEGFAISYPIFWVFSLFQFRVRPRAVESVARARVVTGGSRGWLAGSRRRRNEAR